MENVDVSTEFWGLHRSRILIYSSIGTIIWEREMAHPLEAATLAVVREQESFKKQITTLTEGMRTLERALDKSEGESAELRRQLVENQERHDRELIVAQDRCDYLMRANTELIRQLQNINMFVQDAMAQARVEIEKRGMTKQLTDDFKKDADVDLNELESTILQQGIKNGKSAKSVDKMEPAV
jgi:hypothetical protein